MAIVIDADLDLIAHQSCRHADPLGLGMLYHVGQHLLHDAHDLQSLGRTQPIQDRQVLHAPVEQNTRGLQMAAQPIAQESGQKWGREWPKLGANPAADRGRSHLRIEGLDPQAVAAQSLPPILATLIARSA